MAEPGWWTIPRDWEGETAFIVGGGPSVLGQNVDLLCGRRVIAINSSYERVPFADYLIYHDQKWWREHEHRPALDAFAGKIVNVAEACRTAYTRCLFIKKRLPEYGLSDNPAGVMMRRTTFTGAINFAALLGAKRIVLLGADGKKGDCGRSHHHVPHDGWKFKPQRWSTHYQELATIVEPLRKLGIEVLNASPGSAWDLWPIVNLEDACGTAPLHRDPGVDETLCRPGNPLDDSGGAGIARRADGAGAGHLSDLHG